MVVHRILLLDLEVPKLRMIHPNSLVGIGRRLNAMLIVKLALQLLQRLDRSSQRVGLVILYQRVLLVVVPDLQHVFGWYTDSCSLSKWVRLPVTSSAIHNIGGFYFKLVVSLWLIKISLNRHLIAPFLLVSMTFKWGKVLKTAIVKVKPWYHRVVESGDPTKALSLGVIRDCYRVTHQVIYLERGRKLAITCTSMLLDHLIVWNLLIHLVLGSLNIQSGHWLLSKSYVASSARGTSCCRKILSLNALDIFTIQVTTIPIHFHKSAGLLVHIFKLYMVKMIVLSCIGCADIVSKIACTDPTSLLIGWLHRDAWVLLYSSGIIITHCHEWRYSV